jgi:hypothetical protein
MVLQKAYPSKERVEDEIFQIGQLIQDTHQMSVFVSNKLSKISNSARSEIVRSRKSEGQKKKNTFECSPRSKIRMKRKGREIEQNIAKIKVIRDTPDNARTIRRNSQKKSQGIEEHESKAKKTSISIIFVIQI